jgi:putative FmdB family regulatory protein
MPQYDYHCENCENEFTLDLSITDHEQKDRKHKIHCPKCKSTMVKHVIQSVFVTTSKKS